MKIQTLKDLGSVGSGGGGLQGPQGPTGPLGPTGPAGPIGSSGSDAGGIIAQAHFNGPVTPTIGKAKQYVFKSCNLSTIMISCDYAPIGSPIVVRLVINGLINNDFTLPAGQNYIRISGNQITLTQDDYITLNIMSVGSTFSGSNLTVQLVV